MMNTKFIYQAGDTIIEVMLAMALVGMSLGVSYGIANRAISTGRSAQERSEALKLAESQLELIKTVSKEELPTYKNASQNYCLIGNDSTITQNIDTSSLCLGENRDSLYDLRLIYVAVDGTNPEFFESLVTWISPSSGTDNTVKLRYRP